MSILDDPLLKTVVTRLRAQFSDPAFREWQDALLAEVMKGRPPGISAAEAERLRIEAADAKRDLEIAQRELASLRDFLFRTAQDLSEKVSWELGKYTD